MSPPTGLTEYPSPEGTYLKVRPLFFEKSQIVYGFSFIGKCLDKGKLLPPIADPPGKIVDITGKAQ